MGKHVIVDLEMCNVTKIQKNKEYRYGSEIIQIGAVLLDENNEIIDEFSSFVSPKYGRLDGRITKLTGITEYNLKDAPDLKDALTAFMNWLPEDVIAVSWSHTDDLQIKHEIKAKGIEVEGLSDLLSTWEDCQMTFSKKLGKHEQISLSNALVMADIYYEDGAHDGLVDAKNTALLYAKMQREETLILNEYYVSAVTGEKLEESDDFKTDWDKLFAGIKLS